MATKINTIYLGDGQVEMIHGPSNSKITTDLPPDNGGKGRTFSPTDLFTSALSSCILTIMGKVAERDGLDFSGAQIEIEKIMRDNPRRVEKFIGKVTFPDGVNERQKKKYLACVKTCPVHLSLDPEIIVEFSEVVP